MHVGIKNACNILVGERERKKPLERPSYGWKDNIKVDITEI